jgi:simple sugar transport system ATP-binding protein
MQEALIVVENVHKRYGSVHALRGANLTVDAGECMGLIGDNGAGKSTLAKIIAGFIPMDSGTISWKGHRVHITSVRDARNLGIETVYQTQAIVPQLTVAQNIFLGREEVRSFGPFKFVDDQKMIDRTREILPSLRLTLPPDKEVEFCSGGERQGVAIARAMQFEAELVIMDEPTTALSVSGVEKVLDFIKGLKERKVSSIVISHSLHQLLKVADRFTIMSHGVTSHVLSREQATEERLVDLQLSTQV